MSTSPFGQTTLVTGPEQMLADRAVETILRSARQTAPEVEINQVTATELDGDRLAEITGSSLFSAESVAVVRDLANLPTDLTDAVLSLVAELPDTTALVLVHGGGQKGKALLDKLRKDKAVDVVEAASPKPWEIVSFVQSEAKRAKIAIQPEAAQLLVDTVGTDLRTLVGALGQLSSDSEDGRIDEALVRRYFGGRAEITSFVVCDHALEGRTTQAMEQLRWALSSGVAPVLVTSAMAMGLRRLVKFLDLRSSGMNDRDLARELGMPPSRISKLRGQARRWDQARLAAAIQATARADGEVKGAADDAGFALERLVLSVARGS
ncbi:DNA polymerase III subunit delta [Parenemella sanctibonifatiensis]|nr:DNA polymerase III subunit delta [Parenemella sanctibonifatiensis]